MTDEYALTLIRDADLDWQEYPGGGFAAAMNGVNIHATSLAITIGKDFKKIVIRRPTRPIWKTKTLLEQIFDELISKASSACAGHETSEYQEKLKDILVRQLAGLSN